MLFNNIRERRIVENGVHKSVLEMTTSDFNKVYENQYTNEVATQILKNHLERRGDDGRPSNVEIKPNEEQGIVRIYANINYLGNDHTNYGGNYDNIK